MKLIVGPKANVNYLAKVIKIERFKPHTDPEVTRLKCCVVDGFNIICGIDSEPGWYIYFPTACCLNPTLLQFANLYRKGELNADPTQTGMFDENGRVKAIRLRGELSEGFILPAVTFENYLLSVANVDFTCDKEMEFDCVEHDGKTFWVNKKYVPKHTQGTPGSSSSKKAKQPTGLDRIVENQFRFHYDTTLIKKCPHVVKPNDLISITEKVHGTSGISAYVICKTPRATRGIVATWIAKHIFRCNVVGSVDYTLDYDYLYSSRSVIKNQFYNKNVGAGFYGVDVWKYADAVVRPWLQKGMTVYYEIVGYTPLGQYIQKGYDYGCVPPVNGELYTYGKHFKVLVYRVTTTNCDGNVHEFSAREVQQWCAFYDLVPVTEYYYGYAKDLYPDLNVTEHWNENFLQRLANDKNFYMECDSPTCDNKVPHEGVVIKIENMKSEAFKLKCFKFLDKEGKALDKGEVNIEDEN